MTLGDGSPHHSGSTGPPPTAGTSWTRRYAARTGCSTGSTCSPRPARSSSAARAGSARSWGDYAQQTPRSRCSDSTEPTDWVVLGGGDVDVSGRLIGGCLEVLATAGRDAVRRRAGVRPGARRRGAAGLPRGLRVRRLRRLPALPRAAVRRLVRARERHPGRPDARPGRGATSPSCRRSRTRSATSASRSSPRWTSATPSRSCRWSTAPRPGWSCGDGRPRGDASGSASGCAPASRPGRGRPGRARTGPRGARWGAASSGPSTGSSVR